MAMQGGARWTPPSVMEEERTGLRRWRTPEVASSALIPITSQAKELTPPRLHCAAWGPLAVRQPLQACKSSRIAAVANNGVVHSEAFEVPGAVWPCSGSKLRGPVEGFRNVGFGGHTSRADESRRHKCAADAAVLARTPVTREAAGLDWMMSAPARPFGVGAKEEDAPVVEEKLEGDTLRPTGNVRELNPHWKDGGDGMPTEDTRPAGAGRPSRPPMVGDGGASWRLKALKRAQELAAREGKGLSEVVGDRWGSLASMATSVASGRAAPGFAHLHAKRGRMREVEAKTGGAAAVTSSDGGSDVAAKKEPNTAAGVRGSKLPQGGERSRTEGQVQMEDREDKKTSTQRKERDGIDDRGRESSGANGQAETVRARDSGRDYLRDVRSERSQMRMPGDDRSLSWRRGSGDRGRPPLARPMREADAAVLQGAAASLNTYKSDGSFLKDFLESQGGSAAPPEHDNGASLGTGTEQAQETNGATYTEEELQSERLKLKALLSNSTKMAPAPSDVSRPQSNASGGGDGGGGVASSVAGGLTANQLGAKAMRLRLAGKAAEADELQKQAEVLRAANVVELPLVDARGHAAAGAFGKPGLSKPQEGNEMQRPKRVQRYELSANGKPAGTERNRRAPSIGPDILTMYYADDDKLDLKALVAQQKHGANEDDYDANLAANIARKSRYKGPQSVDDEYEHDDGLEMQESRNKKGTSKKRAERQHSLQVADARRLQTQSERCQLCFDNPQKPKHLFVAMGNRTYLMLPPRSPIVAGHCYIVPMQHEGSTRSVDEDVWEELRNFKKCLLKMFTQEEEKDVIFLETFMASQKRKHCFVECIPLPSRIAKEAPLYFKKAIDEAEDEWSQHNSKRLIDTRQKGLRTSIPKNFSYFHVEFGLQGGYAHVIDDETSFKPSFGLDTIVGMLDLPPEDSHRRPKHVSFEQQKKAVLDFSKMWAPHDWTLMLD
eukprot:SM000090S24343  [mRNA]  locus=s90:512976:517206:+ [translate_table: standard]